MALRRQNREFLSYNVGAALTKHRFVKLTDVNSVEPCGAGELALGIVSDTYASTYGGAVPVTVSGVEWVAASEAIALGDFVSVGASGYAVKWQNPSEPKLGIALSASTTSGDIISILMVPGTSDAMDEMVFAHTESVSLAELNAGDTLIAAVAGKTLTVVDWTVTARGGAVAAATAVVLADTAASPVTIGSIAVAALTENAAVKPNSANVTNGAGGIGVALTASKGITIGKTGSDATTATSLDVTILYKVS